MERDVRSGVALILAGALTLSACSEGRSDEEVMVEAISATKGNLASAARQLGISRMTLYRWMARHGISRDSSSS